MSCQDLHWLSETPQMVGVDVSDQVQAGGQVQTGLDQDDHPDGDPWTELWEEIGTDSYPAEDTLGSYAGLTRISDSVRVFSSSFYNNGQEYHTSRIRCSAVADFQQTRPDGDNELQDSQQAQAD